MTDEHDLLRAILKHPSDDTPRLIMADWFEENDQPDRAEFIRCQIEHSSIPIHECDRIYPGCTVDMSGPYVWHDHKCPGYEPQQRYIKLWDRHSKEWFGDDAQFIMDIERGWPSRIVITLALFLGERCHQCGGMGRVQGLRYSGVKCSDCQGIGRGNGIAKDLFEKWPITSVRFPDEEADRFWRDVAKETPVNYGRKLAGLPQIAEVPK